MPTDLQALVRARAWRWMGGMWWRVKRAPPLDDITGRAIDRRLDDRAPPYPGALPDITDPATLGCMLALAREAWADPTLHLRPFEFDFCGKPQAVWVIASRPIGKPVRYLSIDDGLEADGSLTREWIDHIVQATWFRAEGDALAAAIIAAPGVDRD